jgi:inorganic pyrophosphatase
MIRPRIDIKIDIRASAPVAESPRRDRAPAPIVPSAAICVVCGRKTLIPPPSIVRTKQEPCAVNLSAVSIGRDPPGEVNVVIEVPIGGEPIKYEMDKASGALMVDRFLYTAMRYPGNYGFIPHTLSGDGDPCDVVVANTRAVVPGAIMSCRIVGVLIMEDEAGGDEKLIAVPAPKLTRRYDAIQDYTDLPAITRQQIEHFFAHYKDLEPGKWVKILRWGDAAEARAMVLAGIERAKASLGNP